MDESKKSFFKKSQRRRVKQPLLTSAAEDKQEHTVTQQGSLKYIRCVVCYDNR